MTNSSLQWCPSTNLSALLRAVSRDTSLPRPTVNGAIPHGLTQPDRAERQFSQATNGQAILDAASDAMGDWVLAAACATADPGIFFPDNGSPDDEAKRICGRCPVRSDCLEYSLRTGPHWGVWGGLNEVERNSLARRRKRGGDWHVTAARPTWPAAWHDPGAAPPARPGRRQRAVVAVHGT